MNLKFSKIRDVKSPLYSTIGSAGIDIFMPNDSKKIKIEPGQTTLIPSGLKFNIPPNYVLVAFNRSSIASKKMLIVGACVIDSDYQGEVFVNLSNIGNYYQELNPGDKLIQLILLPAPQINLEEKEVSHLYDTATERGESGFGSTDEDIM